MNFPRSWNAPLLSVPYVERRLAREGREGDGTLMNRTWNLHLLRSEYILRLVMERERKLLLRGVVASLQRGRMRGWRGGSHMLVWDHVSSSQLESNTQRIIRWYYEYVSIQEEWERYVLSPAMSCEFGKLEWELMMEELSQDLRCEKLSYFWGLLPYHITKNCIWWKLKLTVFIPGGFNLSPFPVVGCALDLQGLVTESKVRAQRKNPKRRSQKWWNENQTTFCISPLLKGTQFFHLDSPPYAPTLPTHVASKSTLRSGRSTPWQQMDTSTFSRVSRHPISVTPPTSRGKISSPSHNTTLHTTTFICCSPAQPSSRQLWC